MMRSTRQLPAGSSGRSSISSAGCPTFTSHALLGGRGMRSPSFAPPGGSGTTYRPGTRFGPRAIRQTCYLPPDGSLGEFAIER